MKRFGSKLAETKSKKLSKLEKKALSTRKPFLISIRSFFRNKRLLGAIILYISVCILLSVKFELGFVYKTGEIAKSDIISPKNIKVVFYRNIAAPNPQSEESKTVSYKVLPSYKDDIDFIFDKILIARQMENQDSEKESIIELLMDYGLNGTTIDSLLNLKQDMPAQLRLKIFMIIRNILEKKTIDDKDLLFLDAIIDSASRKLEIDPILLPTIKDVIKVVLKTNIKPVYSSASDNLKGKTFEKRKITEIIRKNEIIVRKGDPITLRHLEIIRKLGLAAQGIQLKKVAGVFLIVFVAFFISATFLKSFGLQIYRDEKRILILYTIVAIAVLWASLLSYTQVFSGYLLAVASSVMAILVCLLVRPMTAIVATPVLILSLSLILGFEMKHFAVSLVAALAGYFYSVKTHDRDSLMRAGITVSISSMFMIFIMSLLHQTEIRTLLIDTLLYGTLIGFITFVMTTGLLPAYEKIFNVVTPHKLLELSNPEELLLKRLLIEAPGTYHHSIMVGNLAETAAEAVGADALLTRIAAYYHDIGKLKRPYFFIENQIHGSSQLNDVSPTLASLVVSSHVKDGTEMARQAGVPEEIVTMINEHHGTCLISFFYQQAQADSKSRSEVSEEQFRYPGPKPHKIESAILMLADCCEAAIRAQKTPTPKIIESTVTNIVESRLFDRQFEHCNITLSQLDVIRATFIKTLAAIYHSRMEYPDLEEFMQREASAPANGDS